MTASAAQAEAFYGEVLHAGTVWTVCDASGIPAPKNGDGQRAMPFWSKESRAQKVVATVAAYSGFATQSVPLAEWRERWLPGLIKDGLMVGLNWSGASATGYDLLPAEVEANLSARE